MAGAKGGRLISHENDSPHVSHARNVENDRKTDPWPKGGHFIAASKLASDEHVSAKHGR